MNNTLWLKLTVNERGRHVTETKWNQRIWGWDVVFSEEIWENILEEILFEINAEDQWYLGDGDRKKVFWSWEMQKFSYYWECAVHV